MTGEPPLILIVEDYEPLRKLLEVELQVAGYRVAGSGDGVDALLRARQSAPDVVVLDWMLPGLQGPEVVRRLRRTTSVPVIMLTTKEKVSERIEGLEAGADDYVTKPFSVEELIARIKVQLRHRGRASDDVLRAGGVTLDPQAREAWCGGRPLVLTEREFDLLELLLRNPDRIFSRPDIEERIWGADLPLESNTIDAHVSRLRHKLREAGEPELIYTVRRGGYVLRTRR